MIKLVALDLDDTLLRSDKTISSINKAAVRHVLQMGIKVVLVSGRGPESMRHFIRELSLEGYEHVAYAGVVRMHAGGALSYMDLCKQSSYIQLIKFLQSLNVEFIVRTTKELIYHKKGPLMDQFTFMNKEDNYTHSDPLLAHDVVKVMVSSGGDKELFETMYNASFDSLTVYQGYGKYLDYMSAHANKYIALTEIAEHYGVKMSEILAMGDADIDREFISHVKYGMTVANAVPSIKKQAYYVSRLTNDENAVESILEKFVFSGAI